MRATINCLKQWAILIGIVAVLYFVISGWVMLFALGVHGLLFVIVILLIIR